MEYKYLVWAEPPGSCEKSCHRFETTEELLKFEREVGFPSSARVYRLEEVNLNILKAIHFGLEEKL